jgi:heptosyltransferase III
MTLERFIQLWTHRYHKYSHILAAHIKAYLSWAHFRLIKARLGNDRQLIAIIRTEHFGDIIAAEPISRYVKQTYPNAYVIWFVKPAYSELLACNPAIDEIHKEFCVTERKVLLKTGIFDQVFELQFKNNNYCANCQVFTENRIALERGIDVFTYFNFGNLLDVFSKTGGLITPAQIISSGIASDKGRCAEFAQDLYRSPLPVELRAKGLAAGSVEYAHRMAGSCLQFSHH